MTKASDNVFPRFLISEGGSTATPAAGRVTVYAKADGLLYSKDDAGTETLVSGGASGAVGTDAIWDAKGDLAVGTGANTASRLAVGATAGMGLIVASGEATGLKWTTVGPVFTAVTRELVYNAATTTSSIAIALSAAIAAVPSTAVLATGYIQVSADVAANGGNHIAVCHQNASSDIAAICYANSSSGVPQNVPFTCKVQQSSGSKVYFYVGRAAGTVTYSLAVTGYWAPPA